MTTTNGTAEHPDVSEISDLTEGLLSPARSVEVREHLDGCPLCADVHESLEEIRGLLGSLPGPPRMPADVAARVDAALAAEALLSAIAPDHLAETSTADTQTATADAEIATADADTGTGTDTATADVSRETSRAADSGSTAKTTSPERAHESQSVPTADGASAADAPPRADRPAGHSRAATGPGRSRRSRRRRSAILGAVFGTAAIGVSVLLLQSVSPSSDDSASSYKAGSTQADGGGDVFSGIGIQDRIHTLLASTPATGEPRVADGGNATKEGSDDPASPKLGTQLPPCVQQGTGRADLPLAAEQGTYNGVQAFLVVLSDPVDGSKVRAYVVDASCVGVTPPVKGELLLTQTYPRH